jgi:hypothetical protein
MHQEFYPYGINTQNVFCSKVKTFFLLLNVQFCLICYCKLILLHSRSSKDRPSCESPVHVSGPRGIESWVPIDPSYCGAWEVFGPLPQLKCLDLLHGSSSWAKPGVVLSRRSIWAHDHFFCPLVRPHHSLQSNGFQSCMTTSNDHQCLLPYPSSRFSSSRLLPLSSRLLPLRH